MGVRRATDTSCRGGGWGGVLTDGRKCLVALPAAQHKNAASIALRTTPKLHPEPTSDDAAAQEIKAATTSATGSIRASAAKWTLDAVSVFRRVCHTGVLDGGDSPLLGLALGGRCLVRLPSPTVQRGVGTGRRTGEGSTQYWWRMSAADRLRDWCVWQMSSGGVGGCAG